METPMSLRNATLLLAAALGGAAPPAARAAEPIVLDVWPGKPPGDAGPAAPEQYLPQRPDERKVARLTNVSKPTVAVYLPPKEKRNGAAVVICPGGAYRILAMDLEGEEVAAWLNSLGVVGVVLKYRVPQPEKQVPRNRTALQDAQRALSLVRGRAAEWGVDPQRIGVLGFSAGGHLAATASLGFDQRTYEPVDDVDKVSCRPDFAVLVYPGYLAEKGQLAPGLVVPDQAPPMFFAHAADDPVTCESSVLLFLALRRAKVPAELHVYASGGHGFGLRPSEQPCSAWPKRCEEWLAARGLLKPTAK
jgi:acetyl esterase/lipase